jgi:catechol 2,3-dioxygenase-like lactoylglutathione lyase family enzyme
VTVVGITVSDLDRAVAFFSDVLTFERVAQTKLSGDKFAQLQGLASPKARAAHLRLGDEFIELTEYESPKGRAFPEDSRSNDRWFQHIAIIVSNMERAHAWLHEKMARHASKDPQRLPDWNKNAAGIKAFYFRDLDGHFLEVLEFPPDKGNPKWHRKTDKLFLGIDHTAIVVADTDASLRFYRDTLGFKVVGGSENFGMEQEDLNNVPGAHLRITTLRAPAGPAIEFLEYLNPRNGRPYPADAQTNDLLHWQTTLVARDVSALAGKLRAVEAGFVSPGAARSGESWPVDREA